MKNSLKILLVGLPFLLASCNYDNSIFNKTLKYNGVVDGLDSEYDDGTKVRDYFKSHFNDINWDDSNKHVRDGITGEGRNSFENAIKQMDTYSNNKLNEELKDKLIFEFGKEEELKCKVTSEGKTTEYTVKARAEVEGKPSYSSVELLNKENWAEYNVDVFDATNGKIKHAYVSTISPMGMASTLGIEFIFKLKDESSFTVRYAASFGN